MHEYTSSARVWGLTCPGLPEEVSRARRWTRDILRGSPLVDDAELIVSELSANAVLHSASGRRTPGESGGYGSFHLAVAVLTGCVALSVTDAGTTESAPVIGRPSDEAPHGRGLGIVSALAHRMEIRHDDQGRTVTAELLTGPYGGDRPW
jgi:anti-sigma regulatory factor (Ser/Thr protein kinase)